MQIRGLSENSVNATSQYRRRASDRAARSSREAVNALLAPVVMRETSAASTGTALTRSESGFLAQLIACRHDFPQMRERRRASLEDTLSAYAPKQALEETSPFFSRYA